MNILWQLSAQKSSISNLMILYKESLILMILYKESLIYVYANIKLG